MDIFYPSLVRAFHIEITGLHRLHYIQVAQYLMSHTATVSITIANSFSSL